MSIAAILVTASALSAAAEEASQDITDLAIEDLLDAPLEIASRKKESTALAASIVSVIDREQLDREGDRTLHEALRRVAGFGNRRSEYNEWFVAMRAYDSTANFLVMLDGHRLNDPITGAVPWDFPLTNVRRIEIIRGPGSAIYGSNAFVATINMITFDESNAPEAQLLGWNNSSDFQPVYTFSQPWLGAGVRGGATMGPLRVQGHLTVREDRGDALLVPSDAASLNNKSWSLARCVDRDGNPLTNSGQPILRVAACDAAGGVWNGRTHAQVRQFDGSLRLRLGALESITRAYVGSRGPSLSSVDTPDLYLADHSVRGERGVFTQLSFSQPLAEGHSVRLRATLDARASDETFGLAPRGFVSDTGVVFAEGLTSRTRLPGVNFSAEAIEESTFQLGDGFAGALDTTIGGTWERRSSGDALYQTNFAPDLSAPTDFVDAEGTLGPLFYEGTTTPRPECMGGTLCYAGRVVNVFSGFAQARWSPNLGVAGVRAAVTAGVRADHETWVGFVASPRAGLTVTADDDEVTFGGPIVRALLPDNLKILYGSAYRSPTLKERFDNLSGTFRGNPDLVAERIQSIEAGVGYRIGTSAALIANYYRSEIRNSIQRLYANAGIEPLRQRGSRRVQGAELEVRGAGGFFTDAYFNGSLLAGEDSGEVPGGTEPVTTYLEDQPKVLFNAGAEVKVHGPFRARLAASFTGERANLQRTTTERSHTFRIPAFIVLDASVRAVEFSHGLSASLFARNILNNRFRDPLPPNHDQDVKLQAGDPVSYLLPREGFTFGLHLSWQPPSN